MKIRWLVYLLMMLGIVGGLLVDSDYLPVVASNGEEKIEPGFVEILSSQGQADYIVRFFDQPDLSKAYGMGWLERGDYVYNTLKDTAEKSQARAKGKLDAAGLKYQTFIAGNELYVWKGDIASALSLAGLPEVESIRETQTYSISPINEAGSMLERMRWAGDYLAYNQIAWVGDAVAALTWGIGATNANDFWAKFGYQGDGIIVANIDTGVQWNHPGLDQAYRCPTNPTDPKCWKDPANICGGTVCDNNGHGTHTMGTMVSDDDPALPYQAGMAPNAKWIACKGCETSDCSDQSLLACADWILAPGGNPANRPHVVNNSWGGNLGGGETWYQVKVIAWRAAGIFPSFSAGNYGSGCNTLTSPGDYQESFSSASHDGIWNISAFSSRGPSVFGHEPYTKPNLTAPGSDIISTLPISTWGRSSGTSMAAPHTSGAVALLWSCNQNLIGQVDSTFKALQEAAWMKNEGNCGMPPDMEGNYTYGYGYLDVLAAGTENCADVAKGILEGYVYDAQSSEPIDGAMISVSQALELDDDIASVTDPSGYYSMTLPVGTYDVIAIKNGYLSETYSIDIRNGEVITQDFYLEWLGLWSNGPTDPTDFYRYDCTWFDDGTGLSSYNLKIYCMGGRTGSDTESGEIWRFDAATQLFTNTGDVLYEDVTNYTANVIEDSEGWAIYVIGGYDADNQKKSVDLVQRYDPVNGEVLVITSDPLPIKVGGVQVTPGACVSAQNKIYCFGGWETLVAPYFSVETWEFDPLKTAGSRWKRIDTANLSVGRSYIQAAVQKDMIYAMGGIAGYEYGDLIPTAVVETLNLNDLAAGWKNLPPLPVATAEGRGFGFSNDTMLSSLQAWGEKLYVVGGGDFPEATAEVLEYDLISGTWSREFPELNVARRNHAGVFVPLCTEDPNDGLPGMWVLGGNIGADNPPFGEPEFYPMPCSDPTPVVSLTKTVGVDSATCATSKRLDIDEPTEVTYCFTMYNNSPITMTVGDLVDSNLGVLLDGFETVLAPATSYAIKQTVTISETTFNLAAWTAYDQESNAYQSFDYASVVFQDNYYLIMLPMNYKGY